MKQILLVGGVVLTLSACGSTPVAPTPPAPANISGGWSGTWEGSNGVYAVLLSLNQTNSTITGTWGVTDLNWLGNVSGTTDASSFTGNLTITTPRQGGGTCSGTGSFSGTAGATTMRWTTIGFAGTCTFPTGIAFNVQRR
jgi:hypothetical protein